MTFSFFNVNHAEAGNFGVLPEGEYEVIISDIKKKQTKAKNADMLNLTLTIRDDYEQEGQKRKVFDNLVAMEAVAFRWQQIYAAVGIEDNASFTSLEDIIEALHMKALRVKLKIEEYNGSDKNAVAFYKKSMIGEGAPASSVFDASPTDIGNNDPFDNQGGAINISDDDLPF